ncbi:MAG: GNAT family N-acetyltransferase [Comamonadaceae bacterium]|jgi:GNAT superfamily N-acetyltransferase|nr:GNAT family N-acetyltransferase [Comamonadaceae bacterium]
MNYLPVQYDTSTLSRYAELFSKCFPASAGFTLDYLDWLYRLNPDGLAIGFDAWDGNKLVAHYVCVPVKALVSGRTVHALLSLNTATHPDYQGRGLFTKLAQFTFAAGAGAGLDCVFGVANANSTGGFVRKLGFRLVEPLEAKIGYGGLEIDWDIVDQTALFARQWSPDSLKWRCANPKRPVFFRQDKQEILFRAPVKGILLSAYAELPLRNFTSIDAGTENLPSLLHLFIGLVPTGACQFRRYISIPHRFRPSPLNFIFLSLNSTTATIEKGSVSFSFLDFDAY